MNLITSIWTHHYAHNKCKRQSDNMNEKIINTNVKTNNVWYAHVQCRARQYGIGNSFEHQVSDLTKFESESTWFLNIDGNVKTIDKQLMTNISLKSMHE